MKDMTFIDCNCMIGQRTAPSFFEPKQTADIKSVLINNGVERALAYHSLSVEYHPIEGNKKLLEEIQGDGFFKPVWVVMPNHTGEFLSAGDLRHAIASNGIKALRMSPSVGGLNYSISEWSMGEIYKLVQDLCLPLMIDSDQISWDELYSFLTRYPGINLILTKVGYRSARYLYPIMDKCMNLYIDISMYKNHTGIEHLCRNFGSGRLLYGTAMPYFSPGSAKAMVLNADISMDDKRNIAGNNVLRLIGEADGL